MIATPPIIFTLRAYRKISKPTELSMCVICGSEFERLIKKHNPRKYCGSKKCQRILRLGYDKPVGFERVPNMCSVFRADIDYYGHPN